MKETLQLSTSTAEFQFMETVLVYVSQNPLLEILGDFGGTQLCSLVIWDPGHDPTADPWNSPFSDNKSILGPLHHLLLAILFI